MIARLRWVALTVVTVLIACATGCGRKESAPSFKATAGSTAKLTVRLAKTTTFPGAEAVPLEFENALFDEKTNGLIEQIYVAPDAVLAGGDVAETRALKQEAEPTAWYIEVQLSPAARDKFARFTRENVGNVAVIAVDGKVVSAPRIAAEIPNGVVAIYGNFDEAAATSLAKRIVGQ